MTKTHLQFVKITVPSSIWPSALWELRAEVDVGAKGHINAAFVRTDVATVGVELKRGRSSWLNVSRSCVYRCCW